MRKARSHTSKRNHRSNHQPGTDQQYNCQCHLNHYQGAACMLAFTAFEIGRAHV